MREAVRRLVESHSFQNVVTAAVLANAVVLGVDTYAEFPAIVHAWCRRLDEAFVVLFVVELTLKLAAWRGAFFQSSWNVFDLLVVLISLLAAGPFSVLRALRILRALRLVSVVPQMRRVVEALVRAVPGISAIIGVLIVFFYIGAVLATSLFASDSYPHFDTLGRSALTLFQLMLFDDWARVVDDVGAEYPGSPVFFLAFTVISGFAVLNLFIAVIVDALRAEHERLESNETEAIEAIEESQRETERDIGQLEGAVRSLEGKLDRMMDKLETMAPREPTTSTDRKDR